MRALLIPAAFAAILSTATIGLAATQQVNGTVKSFDLKAMTLTLNDGSQYALPKNFKDPGLKVGEKIAISWDMNNGKKVAETVTITQ
ncbi:MAG: DUF1344 domain-containing protein [Rhizobiaceae bacterium]|nr:DUF1344 domain-containing protein [Rhizobiaceae bacterium]